MFRTREPSFHIHVGNATWNMTNPTTRGTAQIPSGFPPRWSSPSIYRNDEPKLTREDGKNKRSTDTDEIGDDGQENSEGADSEEASQKRGHDTSSSRLVDTSR
jgi:hypothetical protein